MLCKVTERKFTADELKEFKSKRYLRYKTTCTKVIQGNKTDFALFTLSDGICADAHHTIGISPVIVKKKNALKVVVSFRDPKVARKYSAVGAPIVTFIGEYTIDDAVSLGERLAKAQNNLLWCMPEGTQKGKK